MPDKAMICPHCGDGNAIFESVEPLSISPVIENWKFDNPEYLAKARKARYECLACGGKVTIDITTQFVFKV